jgi:TonB family protein
MRFSDNLHLMVVISFLMHVTLAGVTAIIIKKRHTFYVPSSYKVKIITPTVRNRSVKKTTVKKAEPVKKAAPVKKAVKQPTGKTKKSEPLLSSDDIKLLEERIDRLKEKKKLEDMEADIESAVEDVAEKEKHIAGGDISDSENAGGIGEPGSGGLLADYYNVIYREIKSAWVYTGNVEEDMMTIVLINIDSSGNVRVLGIEKSSGNERFDKSVIRAIHKASPLRKPPFNIGDVGLRFRP